CQLMGLSIGGPDVCLTPPVPEPIPYPNVALQPMGVPAVYNVLLEGGPAHNLATEVPLTLGDEPGIELGVASGAVMGPSRHLMASFTFLVGGIPATRMCSMTITNSTNAPGVSILPSQLKLLVLAP